MNESAGVSKQVVTSKWYDLSRRLGSSIGWVAAQYWATVLLVLAGIGWTRLPDKYSWQVGLTLLVPLILLAAFLLLEAGTVRKLGQSEKSRVGLMPGALTLLVWIAIGWVAWAILGWCDDQSFLWASYLNSKAPAHLRGRLLTYQHIELWINTLTWVVRWIVVPAKLVPHAIASALWGWRLPWRRLIRLLLNWRWWLAVATAALVGVALPAHFFAGEPSGTVSHQIWAVILKVAGAYLLAITCWVLVLAWGAVLLEHTPQPAPGGLDEELFGCLQSSRKWIVGWAIWMAASILFDFVMDAVPESIRGSGWINTPVAIVLAIAAFGLQVGTIRVMTRQEEKQARPIWAALSVLVWLVAACGSWLLTSLWHQPMAEWIVDWIIVPALLIPFATASARWGFKLPWRRVFKLVGDWRWWAGVIVAIVVGEGLPELIQAIGTAGKPSTTAWVNTLWNDVPGLLTLAAWILLMGWFAALMAVTKPRGALSAGSSLPETGESSIGNA